MSGRYVLTSNCLTTGTMNLTLTLRNYLQGRDHVIFRDEDGDTYAAEVNWGRGRIEGLGAYYDKRRLSANETLLLHFEGEEIGLEALTPAAKPAKPRRAPAPPPEPAPEPAEGSRAEKPEKRVKVTPYPREVLFPQVPVSAEAPAFSADLEALGLVRESGGPPWTFRAVLGRRTFSLALVRFGEMEARELLALRQSGRVHYAAIVAGESSRAEALSEVGSVRPSGLGQGGLAYVSPEALSRLVKLRSVFPLGALDLEKRLREGRLDLESIASLEAEISGVLAERGVFSAGLALLAELPPQQIFLLADLMPTARELGLEPDQLQGVLETLSTPPFLLLKRLSPGEFLMRQSVNQALEEWTEYAAVMERRLEAMRL
ncbi:hypothetical protein [Meiothermus granaticius]|uniref:Uncharacterized protein n=1 Tax=Meiothermus granaticius NBRC 107808 TaxID=1227551 RepID=A0A399FCK5_9DEIN|nr:hypothetical protein [Meiothermus granaticius]MCL6525741.1 hypothetical protein [Thermaceae bacterium]RIH93059.1 hypothetical protein Mgrana_01018 [Meiothermus granaticius NBRC 107808]GEM86666.1 hypothetical protein MGR01S_12910 [Meiothermus granaticius NBRC 107808]